jgi:hypothetical protein
MALASSIGFIWSSEQSRFPIEQAFCFIYIFLPFSRDRIKVGQPGWLVQ